MVLLLYLFIAFGTLVYALYYYFTRTFNYWKSRSVIGPDPVSIFGNLKDSALRRKNIGVVFRELYNEFPNEKVVGIYRMTTPSLLLRDLDVIKHVLVKDFDFFVDRGVEFSKEGMRFAKIQSRVCISKLISKFKVEVSKNTPLEVEMESTRPIMGPKGGIPLRIVRRQIPT